MTTTAERRIHHKPDDADRELLNALQAGLPLVRDPYRAVGAGIGMPEDEVLARVGVLRAAGIIRQLSAIFDTRASSPPSIRTTACLRPPPSSVAIPG